MPDYGYHLEILVNTYNDLHDAKKNTNNKTQRKHIPLRYSKDFKCITSQETIQHDIYISNEMTTAPKMMKSYSTTVKTTPKT
ncbi:20734_t:CDS:2 [Gigaspora margarita]|uniref:20734_t:CDS:1 n=1 Tax=Gigaspora margarita TaxID=4874 RepID=A0ABN7UUG8_GIGMA|nr:20734_t:CDS:2 [Gigaspora margarita]